MAARRTHDTDDSASGVASTVSGLVDGFMLAMSPVKRVEAASRDWRPTSTMALTRSLPSPVSLLSSFSIFSVSFFSSLFSVPLTILDMVSLAAAPMLCIVVLAAAPTLDRPSLIFLSHRGCSFFCCRKKIFFVPPVPSLTVPSPAATKVSAGGSTGAVVVASSVASSAASSPAAAGSLVGGASSLSILPLETPFPERRIKQILVVDPVHTQRHLSRCGTVPSHDVVPVLPWIRVRRWRSGCQRRICDDTRRRWVDR